MITEQKTDYRRQPDRHVLRTLAEDRLAALLTLERENTALRTQIAELHKTADAAYRDGYREGAEDECAAVVAWLRATPTTRMWREQPMTDAADCVERGEHNTNRPGRGAENA